VIVATHSASGFKLKNVRFKTRWLIEPLEKATIRKLDLISRMFALVVG
jgi:hypothetical protein